MITHVMFPGIAAAILLAGCSSTTTPQPAKTFPVIAPVVSDTVYHNEYVAEIQAVQYVEIRTRVNGYIEKIHVDEGQTVEQGQLLFSISSQVYEKELQKVTAAWKNALAELKAAEMEWKNAQSLVLKNIISSAELDMVQAKMEALKADVEEAEAGREQAVLNLSFSRIRAPYSGIINRIPNKTGSLLEEGDVLTSISDNREVFAYFNLSESDYLDYITGENSQKPETVHLVLANNTSYAHGGSIEIIESEFDRSTGNIAFRARFPNPDNILKHGANGKVIITKQLAGALMIPQKSTFEIQDKVYVYVLGPDSTLEQRNIVPKLRLPHLYVVESGLQQDERIVYEGVQGARDGDKIHPEYKAPGTTMLVSNSK